MYRLPKGASLVISTLIALLVVLVHGGFRPASRAPSTEVKNSTPNIPLASPIDVGAEQACRIYSRPADTVVYEEEPERVRRYLRQGGDWVDLSHAANRRGEPAAGRVPACWNAVVRSLNASPFGPAAAIVFLHERRTPAGQPVLVVVAYDGKMRLPWPTPGGWTVSSIGLSASVKSPQAPGSPLMAWHGEARRLDAEPFVAMYRLRLLAGQADADDPTHFTIGYELDGRPGIIDGQVLDSANPTTSQPARPPADQPPDDVVNFAVRNGQAKLTREQIWSPEEILRDHRRQGLLEGKRSWGIWTGDP